MKDTDQAVAVYERACEASPEQARALNLEYHELRRSRAEWLAATGATTEARQEVATLQQDLATQGVNQSVLDELTAYQQTIAAPASRRARRKR